jgi:hypothetical protein
MLSYVGIEGNITVIVLLVRLQTERNLSSQIGEVTSVRIRCGWAGPAAEGLEEEV